MCSIKLTKNDPIVYLLSQDPHVDCHLEIVRISLFCKVARLTNHLWNVALDKIEHKPATYHLRRVYMGTQVINPGSKQFDAIELFNQGVPGAGFTNSCLSLQLQFVLRLNK